MGQYHKIYIRFRALFVLLSLSLSVVPASADTGRFVEMGQVISQYINPTRVTVWLPPEYDDSEDRYGVIYMHDGQNIFFPERSNYNKVWAADKAVLRLMAEGKTPPAIIVGIDQPGDDRYRQYFPRVLRDLAPPAIKSELDIFAKGPIISDEYLRFIVTELKPVIDQRFRTRPDSKHTATIGSSMGGLISIYAVAQYPDIFGVVGAVSPHLPLAGPDWAPENMDEVFKIWDQYIAQNLGAPNGRRIWFDHGTKTLDAYYPAYQDHVNMALVKAGWTAEDDFISRSYEGAEHEENAWAARLDEIFGWMMRDW